MRREGGVLGVWWGMSPGIYDSPAAPQRGCPARPWWHQGVQVGWRIELKETAQCLTNSITKGICLNTLPSVCMRSLTFVLPPSPNYWIYFLSHWRTKGPLQTGRRGSCTEAEALTCMQTETASVQVILTHSWEDLGDREGSSVEGSQDPFKSQDREFLRCSALQNHFCLILAEQASKFFFFYHRRGIKHQPATSLLHGEWHFRKQPVGLVLSACICSEMHILTKARRTQLFGGEGKEMQGVAAVCILVQLV